MATAQSSLVEQRFIIRDADWSTYQQALAMLGDRPVRVTYDRGVLELMSPSPVHERIKRLIDRLLAALAEELGIPIRSQGSTTFNREALDRGLEPDECYYVQNELVLRGRDEIDLELDPPPDLAMEVDITRSSLDRMEIYAALGVPELWRYDGERLFVYLSTEGHYVSSDRSLAFPSFPPAEITHFLSRRHELDEISLVQDFRAWVRSGLAQNG